MERIDWVNGKVPINRTNLNGMQDNIEKSCVAVSPTQPTTNEGVWINLDKKEIYVKNNNSVFEKFYSEEKYSTDEQKIGTWIDGKPVYKKTFYREGQVLAGDTISFSGLKIKNIISIDGTFEHSGGEISPLISCNGSSQYSGAIINKQYLSFSPWGYGSMENLIVTIEYTKTTD